MPPSILTYYLKPYERDLTTFRILGKQTTPQLLLTTGLRVSLLESVDTYIHL